MAAGPGLEPGQTDSKSAVLPLHNPAKPCHYTIAGALVVQSSLPKIRAPLRRLTVDRRPLLEIISDQRSGCPARDFDVALIEGRVSAKSLPTCPGVETQNIASLRPAAHALALHDRHVDLQLHRHRRHDWRYRWRDVDEAELHDVAHRGVVARSRLDPQDFYRTRGDGGRHLYLH